MINPSEPTSTPTSSNTIAMTAAAIGLVSAILSGTVGFEHAKSAYEASTGGSANFNDYVTVSRAFWDGLPIAAVCAASSGLVAYGIHLGGGWYYGGAGLVMLAASSFGASVDPYRHLAAYQAAVTSGATSTSGLLDVFVSVYGPTASILAAVAGTGAGIAIAIKAREM